MGVAAYIEQLTAVYAPATVKQYLAAIRMLFDWLVIGQVVPFQSGQLGTGSQARCENRQDTGADGRGGPRPPRCDRHRHACRVTRSRRDRPHGVQLRTRERGAGDAGGRLLHARQALVLPAT